MSPRASLPRNASLSSDSPRSVTIAAAVVAARLHLSVKTIETHVSDVLRKLQLTNRNELTRWAARRRMI